MEEKHHHETSGHTAHHKSKDSSNDTITLTKMQLWQMISGVLGVLLLVSVFTGGFGFSDKESSDGSAVAVRPSAAAPSPSPNVGAPAAAEVSLEGARILGDEDAPVTLIEFSDFQCPFCGRFHSQTLNQIKAQYIDTGKVRFAYMDFPLDSIHPEARPAANAAWCAEEQGKFWEYHDLVFQNQQSLNDANYKAWAQELGLNAKQFNECLDSRKYDARVTAGLNQGSAAGVRGTPGFLLNGQLISGAQPFSVFQQAIDAALAG